MILEATLATPGARWVDTVQRITLDSARALRLQGIDGVIRYLPLSGTGPGATLTPEEVQVIVGAGLQVMGVQYFPGHGWTPSPTTGGRDGYQAAVHALACGLPRTCSLGWDLEDVAPGQGPATVAHEHAWTTALRRWGMGAMVYQGMGCGLSGHDLYWRTEADRFWKSASDVEMVAVRGYCLIQTRVQVADLVPNLIVDLDVVQTDRLGGLPMVGRGVC